MNWWPTFLLLTQWIMSAAMSSQLETVVKNGLVCIKWKCIGGVMSTSYSALLELKDTISIDQALNNVFGKDAW